jgi:hypothetical protein
MRKFNNYTVAILLLALATATSASAYYDDEHPKRFGAGIVLGEPTGLTAKYWVERGRAFDGGLAYSFDRYMLIYGDYLLHFPNLFGRRDKFVSELNPYAGIGAWFYFSTISNRSVTRKGYTDNTAGAGLGIRIPLGIEWTPSQTPLGVFLELVPGMGIIPSTYGVIQGGVGIRYYFD